jgi:SAM-dependent methyltransferase
LNDCGGYDQWHIDRGQSLDQRLQAVADVGMSLCSPEHVVDLGAGRGELSAYFARKHAKVTAIDYSSCAQNLIQQTIGDDTEALSRVAVKCDSVTNPAAYSDEYDLAIAADIVEHLSHHELDRLYSLISEKLEPRCGSLVIHTAPNLWNYRYEHPRQQRAAIDAGFWLPKTRRTYYECLMHINEQNPRILRKQLAKHFPHVFLWFTDSQGMGGSLLRKFTIQDFRTATSVFAIASHKPICRKSLADVFSMDALSEEDHSLVKLTVSDSPKAVYSGESFAVSVELRNSTSRNLKSLPPYPFHICYHWLNEDDSIYLWEGLRAQVTPSLFAGHSSEYKLKIIAPKDTGLFKLEIATVQEQVRWSMGAEHNSTIKIRVITRK